ncbi:ABC transporter substrate-binding protein [Ktedonospora formicarum]|uniref:Riboflavin-binding protein RibY n=1 Tax=Ktedonospora formicarum TaxID=2778364 RepID=A0A8J3I4V7_9CHLR|nr:ABC transporter substrate-binding protein [Ktedonospora formicarum]GHO49529.1 riboflavin-binding protein RibY [Ktedonospora formicarum]
MNGVVVLMFSRSRSLAMLVCALFMLSISLLASGCGASPSTTSTSKSAQQVSIGLGYIPDIQFAPFYVAQSKGYYKDAGLDVTFHHGIVPDLIGSMMAGKNTFVMAGGDELLTARNEHIQAKTVTTIFQKYPISLVVPADSPIKSPADLKGHSIGIPGPYGSSYTALLAFLYKEHLSLSDVKLQSIGFTQVAALLAHRVDAIVGFSNNEPLQLQRRNFPVRTFAVSDYQPLVSEGIIVPETTLQKQPEMVHQFVLATLKGLSYVIAHPEEAVTLSKPFVPGMSNNEQTLQILKATIPIWQGSGALGSNDDATWQSMEQFMVAQKMIKPVQKLSDAYTNQYIK